ncbi:MAG: baeRF3 domain-containing protein [Syntrophales bacterium]
MDQLAKEDLKDLLSPCGQHCVSLYMPTTRAPVEGRQDPIRFKNMVRETEERLVREGVRSPEAKEFLAPLMKLQDDLTFWQHRGDGMAVFYSSALLRPYRLPVRFAELAVVANRFHLKPLLPLFTEDSVFFVLALSQNKTRLIQGNRYGAREVELEGIPASLAEALNYDEPEKQLQFRSNTSLGGGKRHAAVYAHGGVDDSKQDIRRYLQLIDRGLPEAFRQNGTPLLVAGVDYLASLYREVNSSPNLLAEGIIGNPDLLSPEELHARAWKLVQPRFLKARQEAISQYRQSAGTGRTSREITEIIPAAAQGRVDKLVVVPGVQVWGSYDRDRGVVALDGKPAAGNEDLLDLAAIQTLLNGGKVYTTEPDEPLPEQASLIALFRY